MRKLGFKARKWIAGATVDWWQARFEPRAFSLGLVPFSVHPVPSDMEEENPAVSEASPSTLE